MLRQISQNFPQYTTALARRVDDPSEELAQDFTANQMSLPRGYNVLWINGLAVPEPDANPLGCATWLFV